MSQKKSSSTRTRSRIATASSTAASGRRRRATKLARACISKRRRLAGGTSSSSSSSSSADDFVSEKLEALKNLIPVKRDGDDAVAADELFQETADYILQLRTQVVILQKLIHLYGSTDLPEEQREINHAASVL